MMQAMAVSGAFRGAVVAIGLMLGTVGCGSSASGNTAPATRYLAIAVAGNKGLETGFGRLKGPDKPDLARSRADLRSIAATEHRFDQRLLAIAFPSATADIAWQLVQVNEARAALTATASGATSLGQLRGYERRLDEANASVESFVTVLRKQLGLPPPETS
jgi:hypothetical protein